MQIWRGVIPSVGMSEPQLLVLLLAMVTIMLAAYPSIAAAQSNNPSTSTSSTTSSLSTTTSSTTVSTTLSTSTTNSISTTSTITTTPTTTVNSTTTTASTTTSTTSASTTSTTTAPQVQLIPTWFFETGLPSAGRYWTVSYNSASIPTASNATLFIPNAGVYNFTVLPTVINGTTYIPSPLSGSLTAGSNQIITFTAVGSRYALYQQSSGGKSFYKAAFTPKTNNVTLDIKNGFVNHLAVALRSPNERFSLTVANQTSTPTNVSAPSPHVYQYVQINATATNLTNGNIGSADAYISNVTYNFSVPNMWISSQGSSLNAIILMKYLNGKWSNLPTHYVGQNSTISTFQAISPSFSTYAVGYIGANVGAVKTTTANILLPLPTSGLPNGFNTYFWAWGGQARRTGAATDENSNIITVNALHVHTGGTSAARRQNTTVVGYNTVNNNVGNFVLASGYIAYNNTVSGLAANVIEPNNAGVVITSGTGGTATLTWNPSVANSFVVLEFSTAGGVSSAPTLPGGCSQVSNFIALTVAGSEIAVCPADPTGSQSVTVSTGVAGADVSAAAFIFAPYNSYVTVITNSLNNANILFNGVTTYTLNTVNVIGTQPINAIYPLGNFMFYNWTLSNSVNDIIANTLSANTYLTVMGNDVITAQWNSLFANFIVATNPISTGSNEVFTANVANGIQPITYNFLVYNSFGTLVGNALYSTVFSNTNTFTLAIAASWGTGTFMANIIANDLPGVGTNVVANSIKFTVSGATCGITLSNSLIQFGSVNPASSASTSNLITDTNTGGGTVANVYVEGTNMIIPGAAGNFYVSNILWDATSDSSNLGNAVFLAPSNFVDTAIPVNTVSANNIYFGVNVPAAQTAGTYTSNLIIENFC